MSKDYQAKATETRKQVRTKSIVKKRDLSGNAANEDRTTGLTIQSKLRPVSSLRMQSRYPRDYA